MTTYYVDFEGGNDGNDGTSFANRKKTLSNATASLSAGDVVRVMASRDATSTAQNGTFSASDSTLTLTSAVTANINQCTAAWTASANVTAISDAALSKFDANAVHGLNIGAAFTTGLAGYRAVTADFSAYQQISFWIRQTAGTVLAAGDISIKLCSDAAGATPVDSIDVPAMDGLNLWQRFTVDKGSALGSGINSVAIYVNNDNGAQSVYFSMIIACKAPTASDCITFNTLVGRSDGDTVSGWYSLRRINGTALMLENNTDSYDLSAANDNYPYYPGASPGAATLYVRQAIQDRAGQMTISCESDGTPGNPITISGGWNRTDMSTQTGYTFVDYCGGSTFGVLANGASHDIDIERFAVSGNANQSAIYIEQAVNYNIDLANVQACGGAGAPISMRAAFNCHITVNCLQGSTTAAGNNGTSRYPIINSTHNCSLTTSLIAAAASGTTVLSLIGNRGFSVVMDRVWGTSASDGVLEILGGGPIAIDVNGTIGTLNNYGGNLNIANNGGITSCTSFGGYIYDPGSVIGTAGNTLVTNGAYYNDGGTVGGYRTNGANLVTEETSIRHTASGIAWKLAPSTGYALPLKIATVAVAASGQVDVSAWVRRSNTALYVALWTPGGQVTGIANTYEFMTAAADTWEEITLSVTPSATGVIDVYCVAYGGGASQVAYVDDVTITQA